VEYWSSLYGFYGTKRETARPSFFHVTTSKSNTMNTTPDSDYVGQRLVDSGVQHYFLGQYDDALRDLTNALQSQRITVGAEHLCVAHTLGNIGVVLLKLKRYSIAEECLQEAYSIKEKRRLDHPYLSMSDTIHNLGNTAFWMGDYDRALSLYEQALQEYTLGPVRGSPREIAHVLYNMGQAHCISGNYYDALSKFSEAVELLVKARGRDNSDIAEIIEKIGAINLYLMRYEDAMEDFEEALRVTRLTLGSYHVDVAPCLFHVGLVHEAQGLLRLAFQRYEDALDVYQSNGMDNASVQFVRDKIKALKDGKITSKAYTPMNR
jgi:tetratricopeptide (TPR) repeat protein